MSYDKNDPRPTPVPQEQWDKVQEQTLEPACSCDYCTGYSHIVEPEPELYCCDRCERGEPCRSNDIIEPPHGWEKKSCAPYDQPRPTSGSPYNQPVWPLVIDDIDYSPDIYNSERIKRDMAARNQAGIKRYGTPLQIFNGRDALKDAYQEALDCVVYLKQALVECSDQGRYYKIWGIYRSMICTLHDYCDMIEEEKLEE